MKAPLELSEWMSKKLAEIAAKIDIWTFEQESISIFAAEIRNYSELTKALPHDFCSKIQAQKPRELEPTERAAITVTASDWQAVCDVWAPCTTEEKVAAQFYALAFALRQGGAIC